MSDINLIDPDQAHQQALRLVCAAGRVKAETVRTWARKQAGQWLKTRKECAVSIPPGTLDLGAVPAWVAKAVAEGRPVHRFVIDPEAVRILTHVGHALHDVFQRGGRLRSQFPDVATEAAKIERAVAERRPVEILHELADAWFRRVIQCRFAEETRASDDDRERETVPAGELLSWIRLEERDLRQVGQRLGNCLARGYYRNDVADGSQQIWALFGGEGALAAARLSARGGVADGLAEIEYLKEATDAEPDLRRRTLPALVRALLGSVTLPAHRIVRGQAIEDLGEEGDELRRGGVMVFEDAPGEVVILKQVGGRLDHSKLRLAEPRRLCWQTAYWHLRDRDTVIATVRWARGRDVALEDGYAVDPATGLHALELPPLHQGDVTLHGRDGQLLVVEPAGNGLSRVGMLVSADRDHEGRPALKLDLQLWRKLPADIRLEALDRHLGRPGAWRGELAALDPVGFLRPADNLVSTVAGFGIVRTRTDPERQLSAALDLDHPAYDPVAGRWRHADEVMRRVPCPTAGMEVFTPDPALFPIAGPWYGVRHGEARFTLVDGGMVDRRPGPLQGAVDRTLRDVVRLAASLGLPLPGNMAGDPTFVREPEDMPKAERLVDGWLVPHARRQWLHDANGTLVLSFFLRAGVIHDVRPGTLTPHQVHQIGCDSLRRLAGLAAARGWRFRDTNLLTGTGWTERGGLPVPIVSGFRDTVGAGAAGFFIRPEGQDRIHAREQAPDDPRVWRLAVSHEHRSLCNVDLYVNRRGELAMNDRFNLFSLRAKAAEAGLPELASEIQTNLLGLLDLSGLRPAAPLLAAFELVESGGGRTRRPEDDVAVRGRLDLPDGRSWRRSAYQPDQWRLHDADDAAICCLDTRAGKVHDVKAAAILDPRLADALRALQAAVPVGEEAD